MDLLSVLFIPPILFIGVITSYEDFKTGKIRNKWILLGLYYALVVYVLLFFWNLVGEPITNFYYDYFTRVPLGGERPVFSVDYIYFWEVAYNSAIALIAGFALWKYGKFSAGDAKLFFVFSLLLPLSFYWKSYFFLFPSFVLLINIFIIVFLYIIFESLYFLSGEYWQGNKRLGFSLQNLTVEKVAKKSMHHLRHLSEFIPIIILIATVMLCFMILGKLLKDLIGISIDEIQTYFMALFVFIMVVARNTVRNLIKQNQVKLVAVFSVLLVFSLFFVGERAYSAIKHMFFFVLLIEFSVILILFKISEYHNRKRCIQPISPENVRPGMELLPKTMDELKKNEDFFWNFKKAGGKNFHFINEDRLPVLREWCQQKNIGQVLVCRRFPFAFWIFLGVVFTLLYKGAVIYYFKGVFSGF